MTYLQAFLLGGALCLLTQLLFRTTKRAIVTVLTLAYCIGILMTAMGWMAPSCIACGNTIILKVAGATPMTSLRIAELYKEAGLPDGVLNIVSEGVGFRIVDHAGLSALRGKYVSFR